MIKEKPMQDQMSHKNPLYNPSVERLMTEQKAMMTGQMSITTDNAVEVHHRITRRPREVHHFKEDQNICVQ